MINQCLAKHAVHGDQPAVFGRTAASTTCGSICQPFDALSVIRVHWLPACTGASCTDELVYCMVNIHNDDEMMIIEAKFYFLKGVEAPGRRTYGRLYH